MASRRGAGEGSIYQRSNGRWVSYLRLPTGQKRFFSGATRQVVKERLSQALENQRNGTLVAARKENLDAYLNRWLTAIEPSVRPSTYDAYALCVRRIRPLLGHIKLQSLEPDAIQIAYTMLLKRGLSARSVQQTHTVLHTALRQAVRWNLMPRNPTEAATPPRPEQREVTVLNEEEVRQLFVTTEGQPHHALWVLLLTTGLRIGEALGLKWADIDLNGGTMTIKRALQYQRGRGYVFVEPKTSRSRRVVPLPDGTVDVLTRHRAAQTARRVQVPDEWRGLDLVFCRSFGQPLDASEIRLILRRMTSRAGLPDVRVHDLRHTAATYLLSCGVHPKLVQELLGHSTITLTLDTYSHVLPMITRQASAQMERLFLMASKPGVDWRERSSTTA